ncbi:MULTISPECIES: hypothetical protein [unclassified Streptomyces]|uniref:hypothetical protein n=1 Tax=unclassified Streptomyces TaxID=2593676 RepID=UPI002E1885E8|nr:MULTISPECIES: hypothetical protein [unclassified Streptomyces]
MPRDEKWQVVLLVAGTLSTISLVMEHSGWTSAFFMALGVFCVITVFRDLRATRRKRRAERRALLTRLDRLMRREVKRRCR